MEAGLKLIGCPTQPEPIFESRAVYAGDLEELEKKRRYRFIYRDGYKGESVSLTMPLSQKVYEYDRFPPFFEGLLPEGEMLEALLKKRKLDADDYLGQLLIVGGETIGSVTVVPP